MSVMSQTFLETLGLAPPAADDPALWIVPGPDGLAEGLATLVDELAAVEERIAQGERYVANREAEGRAVPTAWRERLHNLRARRTALFGLIAERVPAARARRDELNERLARQWVWLSGAPSDDPLTEEREGIWLRWLDRYEAIGGALNALDDLERALAGVTRDGNG